MQKFLIFTVTLAFLVAFPRQDCTADEKEASTIAGRWKVVEMQARGRTVPQASWRGMRYEFKKDTYTMWAGTTTPAGIAKKPPLQGPYSIDKNSDPHHFNFAMVAGDSRVDVKAIYKIEDKKMHLCFGKSGRPESFETKDTRNLCYVLERMPKVESEKSEP